METRVMSFKDYWEKNKKFYVQLGVAEAIAKMIWDDCEDNVANRLAELTNKIY